MTSTVLVSRVCVSAGPRKLSSPESPGRPPPRRGPSSGQTSSGKRARRRSQPGPDSLAAAGPSVPVLAARRAQVPRPGACRTSAPGGVRSTRAALFVSWHLFPRPPARARHPAPSVSSVYHFSLSTGFSFYSTKF